MLTLEQVTKEIEKYQGLDLLLIKCRNTIAELAHIGKKNTERAIKAEAKVERLEEAAAYACAEFDENWKAGRMSIDAKTAHALNPA